MTSEWVGGRRGGKPARWPAILQEETGRLLCAVVKGRAGGRSYPKTLLGGIAFFGLCGHSLVSRPRGDGWAVYVCASDAGGCGKIGVMAPDFEQDVLARLFSRVDSAKLAPSSSDGDEIGAAMTWPNWPGWKI
jgi:hypothetical protein